MKYKKSAGLLKVTDSLNIHFFIADLHYNEKTHVKKSDIILNGIVFVSNG